jgi:hypothetical protein
VPKVQPATEAPSGRAARGRRVSTTLAEINVVPLVDVMLVLLIICMVTAPMIQRGVDVNLPITARSTQVVGERVFVTAPGATARTGWYWTTIRSRRRAAGADPPEDGRLNDKEVFLRGDGDAVCRN